MEAITVFAETPAQVKALKALADAMNMKWATKQLKTKKNLLELEAELAPQQLAWWTELKQTIHEVKNGTAEKTTWEDFLTELENENLSTSTV
jgi:hypothetical protein